MKKLILTLTIVLMASIGYTQEIVVTPEARPSLDRYFPGDLIVHISNKQAIVTVRHGYKSGGEFISVDELKAIFINQPDDPSTPGDESTTGYTDFVNAVINFPALRTAVRAKLGI